MAKFTDIIQNFVFTKSLKFWGNMVKNYKGEITNNDFFDFMNENVNHEQAVDLIMTAYDMNEIQTLTKVPNPRYRLNFNGSLDEIFEALWHNQEMRKKCRVILEGIKNYLVAKNPINTKDALAKRFTGIKKTFKLSDLESEVLILTYLVREGSFFWPCRIQVRDKFRFYAMALDRSFDEVLDALSPRGKLHKFGFLDDDWDFNNYCLSSFINGAESEALEQSYYKKINTKDILPWEYYGELATKDGEVIKEMIAASKGACNILLYGAPGTGKTSFAKTLAKELGRTALEITQGDSTHGRGLNSNARMAGIQVCNDQEDPSENIMLIDEADELLRNNSSSGGGIFGAYFGNGNTTEKGIINSLLDDMRLPAIWICNAPAYVMDESVRRRFDYSIHFERMNATQRISIWRNLVQKLNLSHIISQNDIKMYAEKYETSAGGIATVLSNVKKMYRGKTTSVSSLIAKLMKPHCQLMGLPVQEQNKFTPAKNYSIEGLNIKSKIGLEKIVPAVRNYLDDDFNTASEDKPRMNLLMFGPPGTGKTEFVKFLGKELGLEVLVKKGSDILGRYVGETEQNLAAAFSEAESNHAILFLDEIDGLLFSRENAQQSWQVSQVNELLQQMENFNGIFLAATNFAQKLDPATLRRFTFKLEFDYLDDDGKKLFFERMFKTTLTPDEFAQLKKLRNLTPGDFRTVRQETFYLNENQTNFERIAALQEESLLKKAGNATCPRIGFCV